MPPSRIRLLCDQNVARQYVDGFRAGEDLRVVTVREVLDARAPDADIAAYAAANGYVVFTSDDDFFALDAGCGRIHYSQEEAPDVGAVLTAVRAVADAYDEHDRIFEHVPDGWV